MARVLLVRAGTARLGLAVLMGVFCGAAACGNLIGLEEWEDRAAASGTESAAGSGGGSATGSGGGSATGSGSSAGGNGGGGEATGAGATGAGVGAGGAPIEPDAGPECNNCVAMNCSTERAACDQDAQCTSLYGTCLLNTHPCCKASGFKPGGPSAEALFACITTQCETSCQAEGATCADCMQNSLEETDVDCGGDLCKPCASGKGCNWDNDCESLLCAPGPCATGKCCQ